MKRLLPNWTEVAIFAVLALLCAALVDEGYIAQDLMISLLVLPVFVMAAVMGLRRSPQWTRPADTADAPAAVADPLGTDSQEP